MFTIYIVDRANQILGYAYPTQEEADDAADRFEAAGCDVFLDRLQACLNKDRYDSMQRRQAVRSPA